MKRLAYDSHMHTPLCKHARGEPEEYARSALERGLAGIIFTCHNPVDDWGSHVRMSKDEFPIYVDMIERVRERFEGELEVRLGLESDYAPGMEGWLEELHGMARFHYILGSVHPQLAEYRSRFYRGSAREIQETYFEHLALAAESGLFDCISHPDLIKNEFPEDWDTTALMPVIQRALDRIAAAGVAMELNTSGVNKVVKEMNPGMTILAEMRTRWIPVVVGSDSHRPQRVADGFERAYRDLLSVGYRDVCYFENRKPRRLSIIEALESLSPFSSIERANGGQAA